MWCTAASISKLRLKMACSSSPVYSGDWAVALQHVSGMDVVTIAL